jgi:hypothetical protein
MIATSPPTRIKANKYAICHAHDTALLNPFPNHSTSQVGHEVPCGHCPAFITALMVTFAVPMSSPVACLRGHLEHGPVLLGRFVPCVHHRIR